MTQDWNAPIVGQPAAIVREGRKFLARFPYAAAGGKEPAHEAARKWRDRFAPQAQVWGFSGRVNYVWE